MTVNRITETEIMGGINYGNSGDDWHWLSKPLVFETPAQLPQPKLIYPPAKVPPLQQPSREQFRTKKTQLPKKKHITLSTDNNIVLLFIALFVIVIIMQIQINNRVDMLAIAYAKQ